MSPDLNPVINNRLAEIGKWCRTPRHIKARNAQIAKHPKCSRCGRPATTPGHSHEDYRDFETYLNAVKTDKCESLCSACNKAERAGKRPCPSCVEKHKQDPEAPIHYITRDQETCRYCEPGYDPEKAKYKREHWNRIRNANNHRIYLERKAARAQVSA